MRFKVGDKVTILDVDGSSCRSECVGKTATVKEWSCGDYPYVDCGTHKKSCFRSDQIKLVDSSPKPQSDLEQLAETANKGYAAVDTLVEKYRDRLEYMNVSSDWLPYSEVNIITGRQLRVIQKPKFEEYTLGTWTVKMVDNMLHIGCKKYKTKEMMLALSGLVKDTSSGYTGNFRINAMRNGVVSDGYAITWAQAEELLAKLEKAGV